MTTTSNKKKTTTVAKEIIFDHARVDPCHCLADGLFRPIKNGELANSALNVSYQHKSVIFHWQHPTECLSIKDQNIFIAVLRIASEKKQVTIVGPNHPDPTLTSARNALNLQLGAKVLDCLVITTTARDLVRTLGLKVSGPALARVQNSLERLAGVTFSISHLQSNSAYWQTNLFGIVAGDGANKLVAINPLLSKALAGKPTTYIDMNEQRVLSSDAAKRVHVWMSAWLRPTEGHQIGVDLLVKHVWGDTGSGNTLHCRRNTIKEALAEIDKKTVWRCDYRQNDLSVFVKRRKLGDYSTLPPQTT